MKLLLITFLLSFNSFAEISVKVENFKGRKFGAKFDTLEKANKWIESNAPKGDFGKNERWVKSSEVEDTSVCIKKRDIVPEKGEMYEECKLPKEYSILICDDAQTYNEGDPCKPITNDMKAKKAEKESRENEKREARNIKKLKKKWSQLNDNQKDKLIKYLLRSL